jgi:hypothetical protein
MLFEHASAALARFAAHIALFLSLCAIRSVGRQLSSAEDRLGNTTFENYFRTRLGCQLASAGTSF